MIFILFVNSMYPWFTWNGSTTSFIIIILSSFFSIFFYFFNRRIFHFKKNINIIGTFFLVLSFLFYSKGFNFIGIIQQLFVMIIITFLLNIEDNYKVQVLNFITKWFAIFLFVSLMYYILYLIGISLPFSYLSNSQIGYSGNNYYLFVINDENLFYFRFRSIFAEPGHLTMGIIPLLFANRFDLKNKFVIVLLVVEFFTFSLAGYITIFLSMLLLIFINRKNNLYLFLIFSFLSISSILIYKSGDEENLFYKSIGSRLIYDENKGTIEGDNRTTSFVDAYFEKYIFTSDSIFGLGFEKTNYITSKEGAGYKIFLLRFGLITFLTILIFYLVLISNYLNKITIGFFLMFLLLILQNTYPFWFCVIFIFITGIAKLNQSDISLK